MDFPITLALGAYRKIDPPMDSSVFLRFLWRDADIHADGHCYHDAIQTPLLVRLLPHGNHDTTDLQVQKWKAANTVKPAGLIYNS